jgi:hypothetical protein
VEKRAMLRLMIYPWGKRVMKHTFLKHVIWAALFAAGAAVAQDAAISGADFTHGKADAQLAAIGSKAVADGQTVVVTAPSYWQAKAAAKIRAGAHGKPVAIRFSNGFYENVLVRTEAAAPAETTKPEAKPAPKAVAKAEPKTEPKARPEPKVAPKARSEEPKVTKAEPKPAIETEPKLAPEPVAAPAARPIAVSAPAPKPADVSHAAAPTVAQPSAQSGSASVAPQVASNIVAVPQVSRQPAVVPIPTAAINATGAQPAMPEPQHSDPSVRQRMLASLNNGRAAMGSLTEADLQQGDQVYSDGGTLAVVRMEGLHRDLYWLQGPVDLQRVQYMPQAGGSYQVTGTIDPNAPATHRNSGGARVIVSDVPPTGSATRARLEKQYNNGQPITRSLTAARLQPEDRLLVDGSAIVVARREGNSMGRYWLTGSIDLGQTGIQKVDGNVYRVTGSSLH